MAASEATVGKKAVLKLGDGGGTEVFTAIAEVTNIGAIERIRKLADATHLTSDNSYEEDKPGMKRSSPVSFDCNWLPAHATQTESAGGLGAHFEAGTRKNFQVVWYEEDGATTFATLAFAAYITRLRIEPTAPNEVVKFSVELAIQGKPTLTLPS